jgi:hypothetical protein
MMKVAAPTKSRAAKRLPSRTAIAHNPHGTDRPQQKHS